MGREEEREADPRIRPARSARPARTATRARRRPRGTRRPGACASSTALRFALRADAVRPDCHRAVARFASSNASRGCVSAVVPRRLRGVRTPARLVCRRTSVTLFPPDNVVPVAFLFERTADVDGPASAGARGRCRRALSRRVVDRVATSLRGRVVVHRSAMMSSSAAAARAGPATRVRRRWFRSIAVRCRGAARDDVEVAFVSPPARDRRPFIAASRRGTRWVGRPSFRACAARSSAPLNRYADFGRVAWNASSLASSRGARAVRLARGVRPRRRGPGGRASLRRDAVRDAVDVVRFARAPRCRQPHVTGTRTSVESRGTRRRLHVRAGARAVRLARDACARIRGPEVVRRRIEGGSGHPHKFAMVSLPGSARETLYCASHIERVQGLDRSLDSSRQYR